MVGQLLKEKYKAISTKRLAIIVIYNDEICYELQLLKLNDYNTNWIYHLNLIKRVANAQNQWFENDCQFQKNVLIDDQVEFFQSLPISLKVTPPTKKNNVKNMNKFLKNYLHLMMLNEKPWEAFKEICEVYEKE
jgi:hypothetical protein